MEKETPFESMCKDLRDVGNTCKSHLINSPVYQVIAINTAIFSTWYVGRWYPEWHNKGVDNWFTKHFGQSPKALAQGRLHTMITNGFTHRGGLHFLFNMVAFHSFATSFCDPNLRAKALQDLKPPKSFDKTELAPKKTVVDHTKEFWTFYLGSIFAGNLVSTVQRSFIPRDKRVAIGASSGVVGLAVFHSMMHPNSEGCLIFLPTTNFYMQNIVSGLFVVDVTFMMLPFFFKKFLSPIDHGAHVGGACVGYLYSKYLIHCDSTKC